MKQSDALATWIAIPLKLMLFAFVMIILFNLMIFVTTGNEARNISACSYVVPHTKKGYEYVKNFASCLKDKNTFVENLEMRGTFRTIDAMPAMQNEFVGTWNASQPRCSYRHTLHENGEFTSKPLECTHSHKTYHGVWALYNDKMIWVSDEIQIWPPDINQIARINENSFILVEQNGSFTKFSRVDNAEEIDEDGIY